MSEPVRINKHFNPKVEPVEGIKLPIELHNNNGDLLASISYDERRGGYCARVNNYTIDNFGYCYEELTDCLTNCFAYLYQEMQEHRKVAEKHWELTKLLREIIR